MVQPNDGDWTFPVPKDAYVNIHEGITMRDYFAAAALQGLLTDNAPACSSQDPVVIERERREYAAILSTASYRFADAMLKAREES